MIAVAESGWWRVNFSDLFGNRRNGFVYDNIFGRFDDLELGDVTVFLDSNPYERRNLDTGRDCSRWLDPRAVKTVMQHVAIPAEFGCASSAAFMISALAR